MNKLKESSKNPLLHLRRNSESSSGRSSSDQSSDRFSNDLQTDNDFNPHHLASMSEIQTLDKIPRPGSASKSHSKFNLLTLSVSETNPLGTITSVTK